MAFNLDSIGTSPFKRKSTPNWQEGVACFMIEGDSIYFSRTLLNNLDLGIDSRVTFGNSDNTSYICNATGLDVDTRETFRVAATDGDYKGSSKCRNGHLLGALTHPEKYNFTKGEIYTIGTVVNSDLIYAPVNIPQDVDVDVVISGDNNTVVQGVSNSVLNVT